MMGMQYKRWMTVQSIVQRIYIHLKTIVYSLWDDNDDVIRCYVFSLFPDSSKRAYSLGIEGNSSICVHGIVSSYKDRFPDFSLFRVGLCTDHLPFDGMFCFSNMKVDMVLDVSCSVNVLGSFSFILYTPHSQQTSMYILLLWGQFLASTLLRQTDHSDSLITHKYQRTSVKF